MERAKTWCARMVLSFLVLCLLGGVASAQHRGDADLRRDGGGASVLQQARWSPYLVGAGIGVLSILTFLLSDEAIGVSGAFAGTAGMIERLLRGKKVENKDYYRKHPPRVNWEWMFVVGLMIGAFASATLSGTFEIVLVPSAWAAGAGDSRIVRWGVAFLGGAIMGFGARWARGCTSGHGISGTLQLAVGSWMAVAALFLSGIITAVLLFHVIM